MKFLNQNSTWIMGGFLLLLMLFSSMMSSGRREVFLPKTNIEDAGQFNMISDEDVQEFIQKEGDFSVSDSSLQEIDLNTLEKKIESNQFVKNAEVSRTLNGNLLVDIQQVKPLIRIRPSKGKGNYLTQEGKLVDAGKHTARVPIFSGSVCDSLVKQEFWDSEEGKELFAFVEHIRNEPFWQAQISQIDFDKNFNMYLYTQVGKQLVEFGTVENYEGKLRKLRNFYTKIAPRKGWNKYDRVKLQYNCQTVCE